MEEEREEISCECQEIHEDLLKIVNEDHAGRRRAV